VQEKAGQEERLKEDEEKNPHKILNVESNDTTGISQQNFDLIISLSY